MAREHSAETEEVLLGESSDGLQCTEKVTKCKDAVCYLSFCENDNIRRGTGFFTKIKIRGKEHKYIATNNHVLPCKEIAQDGIARFFFEGDNQGIEVKLQPDLFFTTNKDLDYTLVGCDSVLIEEELGITPLDFEKNNGCIGDDIFIFQHPKGEPKKVSYQKISNLEPPFLFYKADTDVGSSGSPVLLQFRLIAIHSKGSDFLHYNKGTLCEEILQHLNHGTYTEPKPMVENDTNRRKREILTSDDLESSPVKKRKLLCASKSLTEEPTESALQSLATDIVDKWKSIGRKLGLPNTAIVRIHKDNFNYEDITEKAFAMLLAWKEIKGKSATILTLRTVLEEDGLNWTAMKHC